MRDTSCRGLVGFIIDGQRKLGYRRFDSDGDPSTLGDEIIHFINPLSDGDILEMQTKVDAIEWIDNWVPCDQERGLLERISEGQTRVAEILPDDISTQKCDYIYYIDFENRRIETEGAWFRDQWDWGFDQLELGCFSRESIQGSSKGVSEG